MTHILLDLVHEITPRFQQISRKFADFLIISPRERFEFFSNPNHNERRRTELLSWRRFCSLRLFH